MSQGETHFDVIVVGVGSMGAAACYHLAKRGVRVLGLEQFEIPHTTGSHHGRSRMIRQAYFEHPDYVPLLRRAYQLWSDLQSAARARKFFHLTGGIYIGAEDGEIVPGSMRAAREHGLPHQLEGGAAIRERYPTFVPGEGQLGFFEENAGFLVPEIAVAAHADGARRQSAELREGVTVKSWRAIGNGVEVESSCGATYTADHLVITSGAWSAEVASDLGIELWVSRQVMAWFEPLGDLRRFEPGRFPCWFIETESPYGHYGFPILPDDPGLKVALHRPGERIPVGQLGEADRPPDSEEVEGLHSVLDRFLPGCAGDLIEACTCRYTNSLDGHFVLGQHPLHERVSVACGFSGHGFKFASVMGEVLADLAIEGATDLPVDFLSPSRFG